MENQMTVDEQLDRMNEAEFKAFLEACTHKRKKTLEQAAMFSQLDRPGKAPEEQIPPLTTTKHSSSLQSLSQSHDSSSRKNSQIHTSKAGTSSGFASSLSTVVGGSGGYQTNNNTHHHHTHHLNSSFNSNNNHNLVKNTNCASTSLSSTSSSSGDNLDPLSYSNSQNQQTVNCVTAVPQNNSHPHLYTPSSYYSSASSSPSQTEEDTATTSANSSSSSPNSTHYSTTTFTATAPPTSRQYRHHSQSQPNTTTTSVPSISTTTSSSISVNFNLKRPTPKPVVHNHVEASTASLPSPYFFNCRTAAEHQTDSLAQGFREGFAENTGNSTLQPQSQSEFYVNDQSKTGNIQLRSEYPSVHSVTGDFATYKPNRVSPRSSRSGTPVQGETASASLNLSRRVGTHGGSRNKKPKETILSATERGCIADKYENLEDLVSYITGEPEKITQTVKKPKKKGKRKETLSKSHSLDENTLGAEINPSMETRSVSSTLLENKLEEKPTPRITTEGLDLSPQSTSKLEQIRSHASTEFITVINRKKSKNLKSEVSKGKQDQNQKEDSPKSDSSPKQDSSAREDSMSKQESVSKKDQKDSVARKESKELSPKQEQFSNSKPDNMAAVVKSEALSNPSSHKEINPKQDAGKRYETPPRRNPEVVHRKYSDSFRKQDGFRRPNTGLRQQEQTKRKDSAPKDSDFPHLQESVQQKRQSYSRHNSEPKPSPPPVAQEPVPKPIPKQSPPELEAVPVKSEDAIKFCGVTFENKSDILGKSNVAVDFDFGVTDVLSQLANSGAPESPQDVPNNKPVSRTVKNSVTQYEQKEREIEQNQIFHTSESQNMSAAQSTTPPQPKQQPPSLVLDKESLLGRHPQSVLSPPVHFMPVSVPLPLPMTGSGYPLSTASFFQPLQQPVPVGVMQYFQAHNMPHIPQSSAPIMTAIPAQGTGNMQPQFVNPITLTPQQQQQIIQHQLLQHHQQQQAYNTAQQQQPLIQYQQLILKPSPPQQYGGNQQNVSQYTPPPSLSTSVPHGQQVSSYSHIQGAGNYSFHSRNNNMIRSNQPQLGNYGLLPQNHQQQYGPSQPYNNPQNSSSHQQHYNHQGPPGGHYNYIRGNSRSSNQTANLSHNYGPPQPSPQYSQSSGHSPAQTHHTPPNPGHRSLPSHVQTSPGNHSTYPEVTLLGPMPIVVDGYMMVNSCVNPMANYYTPPPDNEADEKCARAGEEFMNEYVEKINERISKGATVHRL